jgi:hypothetical protein
MSRVRQRNTGRRQCGKPTAGRAANGTGQVSDSTRKMQLGRWDLVGRRNWAGRRWHENVNGWMGEQRYTPILVPDSK